MIKMRSNKTIMIEVNHMRRKPRAIWELFIQQRPNSLQDISIILIPICDGKLSKMFNNRIKMIIRVGHLFHFLFNLFDQRDLFFFINKVFD